MPPAAFALVITSALLHASWNFLLKRTEGGQVVVGLSKVAEALLFAPIFLVGFASSLPPAGTTLWLTGIAAAGVGATYFALSQAYRHGELSFVYPVSRGAILVFLPVAGFFALGERLSPVGASALGCIATGILVLNLRDFTRQSWRRLAAALPQRATLWSLATAFVTATFTIWDKRAVAVMEPFAYMYLYTLIVALGYAAWLVMRTDRTLVVDAWRGSRWSIVAIGALNTISYLLILAALRTGVTSYVLGLRQLSIAAGVALGWRYLREPFTAPRAAGTSLIIAGCLLLTFSLQT